MPLYSKLFLGEGDMFLGCLEEFPVNGLWVDFMEIVHSASIVPMLLVSCSKMDLFCNMVGDTGALEVNLDF